MTFWEQSIVEVLPKLRRGDLTVEGLARACLERIEACEPTVRAWQYLDPEQVLAEARRLDRAERRGPLHGIPVGVKDIMNTADMPTTCGSPIYDGHRPAADAACVAWLREAGALIVGKTVTTEFAYFRPGPTANPHNTGHTPGGSSSGSAAAVACGMVPLALGSQTAASLIRPASYCGVVGFKSAHGSFALAGVQALAHSLDSLGWLTRRVGDAAVVFSVLSGADWPEGGPVARRPRRVGLCRTYEWDQAEPATVQALETTVRRLAGAGVEIREAVLPKAFAGLCTAQKTVMAYEAARTLVDERRRHRDRLSPEIARLLDDGLSIDLATYRAACDFAAGCRQELAALLRQYDLLLAPSAPGEAPSGLTATGDPVFSRMWTLLGVPSLSLPAASGPAGLPVGVQVLAAPGEEVGLFAHAAWIEARLSAVA